MATPMLSSTSRQGEHMSLLERLQQVKPVPDWDTAEMDSSTQSISIHANLKLGHNSHAELHHRIQAPVISPQLGTDVMDSRKGKAASAKWLGAGREVQLFADSEVSKGSRSGRLQHGSSDVPLVALPAKDKQLGHESSEVWLLCLHYKGQQQGTFMTPL